MVRKLSPLGHYYHVPPYTDEENAEFMRRAAQPPVAFAIRPAPAAARQAPSPQGRPPSTSG
jgi:hypothetical protein